MFSRIRRGGMKSTLAAVNLHIYTQGTPSLNCGGLNVGGSGLIFPQLSVNYFRRWVFFSGTVLLLSSIPWVLRALTYTSPHCELVSARRGVQSGAWTLCIDASCSMAGRMRYANMVPLLTHERLVGQDGTKTSLLRSIIWLCCVKPKVSVDPRPRG